jgi:hypothetical protein
MVTLEQYQEAILAHRRQAYAWFALLLIFLIAAYTAPLILARLLHPYEPAAIEACAQWIVQQGIGPKMTLPIGLLVTLLIGLVIGLPLALPVIGVLQWINCKTRRDRRLFCPHCDALLRNLAMVTGNCQHCGGRALELQEAVGAQQVERQEWDKRLLTVDEFNAAVRDRLHLKDPNQRDPRLKCPRCQADLMGKRVQVVATRTCPRCQAPVLEDPESTLQSDQRLLTLPDFRLAHSAYGRWSLFGGILLVCLAFVPGFVAICWEAPLRRLLGSAGSGVLLLLAFIVGAYLVARAGWSVNRRVHRRLHLDCPHCGRSLFHPSGIVIGTRRCHHCGRRALDEEDNLLASISPANAS